MASIPHMLAVANKVPVTNVKELIALAKAKPDTITFGTTGPGTIQRIATEYFAGIAGIKLVHVPYKGANETTTAILAGEIDMTINGMSNILPHIGEGKLKALAVSTVTRNPLAPDVPTMQEAGVPGYSSQGAFGLFAPAGTPKDIIAKIHADTAAGAGAAGREKGAGGAELRHRRRGAGRIREIHRRRTCQMAEGDQGSRYQDQLGRDPVVTAGQAWRTATTNCNKVRRRRAARPPASQQGTQAAKPASPFSIVQQDRIMFLEIAQVDIKPGQEAEFEAGVAKAAPLFKRAKGCKAMSLQRSVEKPSRYRLFLSWDTVENHTNDFRGSADFRNGESSWRTCSPVRPRSNTCARW